MQPSFAGLLLPVTLIAQSPPRSDLLTPAGTLVARAEIATYDPARHDATCKVFHHLFAPDGRLLTKGDGGTFPHHRGLFLGWNQTRCDGTTHDFWHMNHGETQRFVEWRDPAEVGMPAGAQLLRIDWCAKDGGIVLHELRGFELLEATAEQYAVRWLSRLWAAEHEVLLDGDPQHAGQQFRALQAFAEEGAESVRYLRPTKARSHGNDVWTDCSWTAAVLPLPSREATATSAAASGPVTVLRVEGRQSPPSPTWSTRPYGRFGTMHKLAVDPEPPMTLDVVYVVALGQRDETWCRTEALRFGRPDADPAPASAAQPTGESPSRR